MQYTAMTQEQPSLIDRITVVLILSSLQYLNQGPKICNSLPISITGLTSFSSFKKKMIRFLMTWVWIDLASLPQLIYQHSAN